MSRADDPARVVNELPWHDSVLLELLMNRREEDARHAVELLVDFGRRGSVDVRRLRFGGCFWFSAGLDPLGMAFCGSQISSARLAFDSAEKQQVFELLGVEATAEEFEDAFCFELTLIPPGGNLVVIALTVTQAQRC